jgi:hypothetical protein
MRPRLYLGGYFYRPNRLGVRKQKNALIMHDRLLIVIFANTRAAAHANYHVFNTLLSGLSCMNEAYRKFTLINTNGTVAPGTYLH